MANNKLLGIEEIICDEDTYLFKVDFSFCASLEQSIGDPLSIYEQVCVGGSDPEMMKSIMVCSLKSKNGQPVKNIENEVEELITRNGLQDCLFLCRHLLTWAVVGDVKKSKLRKLMPSKLTQLITEPFLLENSRNRRLLWVYHLLNSGLCVCFSFSLFVLLFVYNTGFAKMVLTLVK